MMRQKGSNRTIVGLKLGLTTENNAAIDRSNRTIVGLKRGLQRRHCLLAHLAAIAPLWD